MLGWLLQAVNCNNEKIAVQSKLEEGFFLTYSELEEVLLDVECTMNNRPLCYQGEDFENQVTTPNILLRGKPARLLEDL